MTSGLVRLQAGLERNGREIVVGIELALLAIACSAASDIKQRANQIGASTATAVRCLRCIGGTTSE